MFETLRDSFSSMVEALRSDPSLAVAIAEFLPPEPSEIAQIEAALGYSLGPSITSFYQACGGIKLVWTPREPEEDGIWTAETAETVFEDPSNCDAWLFKSGDLVGAPQGCIWIPSCKEVFSSGEEWADIIYGQDEIFDHYRDLVGPAAPNATEQVVPFDYASMFYDFAFLMNGKPDPKLIRGDDNGASFSDSRLVSLAEYVDILIASKGDVEARHAALAT